MFVKLCFENLINELGKWANIVFFILKDDQKMYIKQ